MFAPAQRRFRPWIALAVAVVALVLLLTLTRSQQEEQPIAAPSDEELLHIHGLGVDPADGRLHVATHTGVFALSGGGLRRIGDRYQDTMGFTVVGPNRFLASGHPDGQDKTLRVEGKPPLLGLIESNDGARSWQPRSLLGEADFHLLAASKGTVYGYSSTTDRLMATTDLERWEARREGALMALVADPGEPQRLVGVDRTGVVLSADGGRSWSTAPDAPPRVTALVWDDRLWAATATGSVHFSNDAGATWAEAGRASAAPVALAAAGDTLYLAADDGRVLVSRNRGSVWSVLHPTER